MEDRFDPSEVLPVEVMDGILVYLTLEDLAACSLVSSRWRALTLSDSIWRRKCSENAIAGFKQFPPQCDELDPPMGSWARYYRISRQKTINNWASDTPFSINNHSQRKSDMILYIHTDGRLICVTYIHYVRLYRFKDTPFETVQLDKGSLAHRKAFISGNTLIVTDKMKLRAFRQSQGSFSLVSTFHFKEANMEPLETLFTRDYVYVVMSGAAAKKLIIWCCLRLSVIQIVELPEGHDVWFLGESFFFHKNTESVVRVRKGLKELSFDLGMSLCKFRSDSAVVSFLGKTEKGVYQIVVFNWEGRLIWREESPYEVVNLQPFKRWGLAYKVREPPHTNYWIVKSFAGVKTIIWDDNLLGRPNLIGGRYVLYQSSLLLVVMSLDEKKPLYKRSTCSYFSHHFSEDCIIFHDSYSFDVLCYKDKDFV